MSLIVEHIKCHHSSDSSGDDIYLIIFRGRKVAPFESNVGVVGPGAAWADFEDGDERGADVKIAATTSNSVYAVMMIDQDSGKDISGDAVINAWRTITATVWKSTMLGFVAAGQDPNSAASGTEGFKTIKKTLESLASIFRTDDDVIDVKRVMISNPSQGSQMLEFHSPVNDEHGRYDVWFKHV